MNFLNSNIKYLCKQSGISTNQLLEDYAIESFSALPPEQFIEIAENFGIRPADLLRLDLKKKELFKGKDLKFLILDVDGVLTDGGMYYSEAGEGDEFKKFNTKDGMGIKLLQKQGFQVGLLSSGTNAALIRRRAKTLGIQYVHAGKEPKVDIFNSWCKELGIGPKNAIHFGDDVNDIPLMKIVGLSVCPADAVPAVQKIVDLKMTCLGGHACVREFIDKYLL